MPYELNLAPKDLAAQCAAFRKQYPTEADLPGEFIIQPKFDGCLAIVVADPISPRVFTRTGELIISMGHVLDAAVAAFPGMVLFGEAYQFDTPHRKISGMVRRHNPEPSLFLVAFDIVPVADWEAGFCNTPYKRRLAHLEDELRVTPRPGIIVAPSRDLSDVCYAAQGFANSMVDLGGYDGAILRDPNAKWVTGASKNGEAIKVKPIMSKDLEVTGWFEGKGKHEGRAGGISVLYKGVESFVGTGFTDRMREALAAGYLDEQRKHREKVIAEVEFMEVTDSGKLREPRFKAWRFDKTEPDNE